MARSELVSIASEQFGDMVKAVVDIKRLWGVNLYPVAGEEDWIEYDSMINVRPSQGNRTRGIEDAGLRDTIRRIVSGLVK